MITDLRLNQNITEKVKSDSVSRGAFSDDSDIDIALVIACDRIELNKYSDLLAEIATKLAVEHLAIVNFVCLPEKEFEERRRWYPYYKNIDREGELLYGRQVL